MEIAKEIIDKHESLILVKGDISGIQEFIFNVKSDKAARTLKAKSFFVKAVSIISVHYLLSKFDIPLGDVDTYTISISGGNFFILVPNKQNHIEIFNQYKKDAISSLSKIGLSVILTHVEIDIGLEYGEMLQKLNNLGSTEKYKLFDGIDYHNAFDPFINNNENHKIDFSTLSLYKKKSFTIKSSQNNTLQIAEKVIRFLGHELILSDEKATNPNYSLEDKLDAYYPFSGSHISTFEELAGSMGKVKKLGILKLDVDNLGTVFYGINNVQEHKSLSENFRFFFENELSKLIKSNYSDNVYSIISGGDDCFFVGNWNAIIQLAFEINGRFHSFWNNNEYFSDGKVPTLSAGIVIVHSKFPVIRFAEMAEEALLAAKTREYSKNRISIFNIVIKWDDWQDIKGLKKKLENFTHKKPKSLLMNARKGVLNHDNPEIIELSDYWELAYHLREVQNQGHNLELNNILLEYEKYLNKSISGPEKDLRYRYFFPIAARLVELETRI